MRLLGRRCEGRVVVRELKGSQASSRIHLRSFERSDFCKLQASRECVVSSRVSKISGLRVFLWLAWLLTVEGSLLRGTAGVTLAWNPSPDPNVVGYRLYYGSSSQKYTSVVSVGPSARTSIPDLAEGVTYYFAVTAVNNFGMESSYSNELSYSLPGTRPRLDLLASTNKKAILRVTGPPGHAYEIQATQNFTQWEAIGVVTLDSGASRDFTDVTAAGRPLRFYRLREIHRPSLRLVLAPSQPAVLRITGQPGHLYEVQATQDFTNWNVIGVAVLGLSNSLDFIDTTPTGRAARFYRLREIR